MYSSIMKQKNSAKQDDEPSSNFTSGSKKSGNLQTMNENISSSKLNKIKSREITSPYTSELSSNKFQKKKFQSQSVEKYNQKMNKGSTLQQWKQSLNKTNKNQSQEEDNKDLQTTAVSDLRGSQNSLFQKNKKEFKRNANSPTSQASSKQEQQQLTSSVEYSTNQLNNISTATNTTIASRGNSRISKQLNYQQNKTTSSNSINNISLKSPKYSQQTNPNSTSINPWNINAQRKINFNQEQEGSDNMSTHLDKQYRTQKECSPDNYNSHQRKNNKIPIGKPTISQKLIQSPADPSSDKKKNREIQSANTENSNSKMVKGIKSGNSKQQIIDRTKQNNAVKSSQTEKKINDKEKQGKRDSGIISNLQKKTSLNIQQQNNKNKINADIQNKNQKNTSSNNDKESFNKKLNQKIQKKTFERSTNDVNSASDTEYFEMSQKFSTIGDTRIFQIENFIGGGSSASQNPSPQLKNNNDKRNQNQKNPHLKNKQDNGKKQNHKDDNYNHPYGDDEIEEKIETESNVNTPCQTKRKQKEVIEVDENQQIDDNISCDEEDLDDMKQARITQDFKDSNRNSEVMDINPHCNIKNNKKQSYEGHDGDDEDNSADYTDYEKHKKINSTGLSFTKPNLTIRRNESYMSDLQKTQDKLFQKQSNAGQNTSNQNTANQNLTTQQEYDFNQSQNFQGRSYQIDEAQEEEFNQSQTRFFKDQITNIMMTSNLRPFTPPFQQVCQMNSSNIRKQDSLQSNTSLYYQTENQSQSIHSKNQQNNQQNPHFKNSQQQKIDSSHHLNKSSISSHKGDNQIEVIYDDILNCYYDPKTNQYYELKS